MRGGVWSGVGRVSVRLVVFEAGEEGSPSSESWLTGRLLEVEVEAVA